MSARLKTGTEVDIIYVFCPSGLSPPPRFHFPKVPQPLTIAPLLRDEILNASVPVLRGKEYHEVTQHNKPQTRDRGNTGFCPPLVRKETAKD